MIILYAIPVFMLMIAVEAISDRLSKRGYYRFNDALGSLATGMLNRTMNFLTLYVNWAAYSALFGYFGYFELPVNAITWLAAFVIYDFFYYWSHRLAHTYSLFWNAHAVHHQSEEFNLTTALRQPFTGVVQGSLVYLPMTLMGFSPAMVAVVGSLNLIYQFWVHTRFVPKLGYLEAVFVTPSNHRVHHGMNDRYIDRNFGGVFILWDRLFGTFQDELETDPVVFGVRKPLNSFNPFYANVQIYAQMLRDIWVGKSVHLAWQVLTSRTGQRPEAIAQKAPIERLDLASFQPFNPTRARGSLLVVWSQLIFSLIYTVWFLLSIDQTGFVSALAHFLPLGLALFSMGMLLEGRTLGWWLEGVRLAYIGAALTVLPVNWPVAPASIYLAVSILLLLGALAMAMRRFRPVVSD
ncbi:sterol desaturase family protein [Reinekea blandensis]|uniref:Fatty acid hydroxylase domain-containing protein n=1 Tax=Reinekea blandensis MED297 TaxID=314283 RepID=A4BBL1_9GAMM|nr:sterol desaturase family protein [Reinekea blandensis]EAR10346.1 hypothetical protein MED297_00955 [Reinekea sp. MED297] [Reinekea blandensis MED297]